MDELKALNEGCWEWLSQRPPEQWLKALFSERSKCDMLLNNVCQQFNSIILDARSKAIITMVEWIREHLTKRLVKNRERARAKWKGRLCPKIEKILERNSEKVANCVPIKSSERHYQVRMFDGGQYTVDIGLRSCSCRSWQLSGIPCTHSICAILGKKLDPNDFVDEAYNVESYLKAYENPILGISYEALWGETFFIPPLPPDFGNKKNRCRKATKRRLEADEKATKGKKKGKGKAINIRRQHTTLKCRKCGIAGHNSATCKKGSTEQGESGAPVQSDVVDGLTGRDPTSSTRGNQTRTPARRKGKRAGSDVGSKRNDKRCGKKKVQIGSTIQEETPQEFQPGSCEMNMAPPNYEMQPRSDQVEEVPDIATQETRVASSLWNPVAQPPTQPGPLMYQQLQMGQLPPQPRVQIRAPPPSISAQFVNFNRGPVQCQSFKKNVVDCEGRKFMDLSSRPNDAQNGKKKEPK